MKSRLLWAGVVVALVACVVWLLTRTPPPAGAPVQIATVTWVGFGPLYIAQDRGFFKDEGLAVNIQKIEDLGALRASLASGKVDIIVQTIDSWAVAAAQNLPAVCILKTDESFGGDGLVVKSDVNALSGLRGKKVAFPRGLAGHFFLLKLLRDQHLSPTDIQPIYMEAPDAAAAFIVGRVDAALTWEPFLTQAAKTPNSKVLVTTKDYPGLIVDVLLASDRFAGKKQNRETLSKLLRAWFRAVEFTGSHPEEAAKIMNKHFGIPAAEVGGMLSGLRFTTLADNLKEFGNGDASAPIVQVFDSAGSIYHEAGLIDRPVQGPRYFNGSFLHAIQ
jgi:NitT/TauT family transport system substrate-binding protein